MSNCAFYNRYNVVIANNPNISCDQQVQPEGLPDYPLCAIIDKNTNKIYLYFYSRLPGVTPHLEFYLKSINGGFSEKIGYSGGYLIRAGTVDNVRIKNSDTGDNILVRVGYHDIPDKVYRKGFTLLYDIVMDNQGKINPEKSCVSIGHIFVQGAAGEQSTAEISQTQTKTPFYNNENFFDLSVNNYKRSDNERSHNKRSHNKSSCEKRCQKKCYM
jgi:hypothetical protein